MKDEIKEILDKLKDGNWYNELDLTGTMWIELTWEETHLLLDYITTLQEENKRLKNREQECINHYLVQCKYASEMEGKYITLKARKDKAIEYIKNNLCRDNNGCGCWWYGFEYYVEAKKELLEMLQGDDNNAKDNK